MRRLSIVILVMCALLTTTGVATAEGSVAADRSDHADKHLRRTFVVRMTGRQEVPPVETRAKGVGAFHLSRDGQTLYWKIGMARIVDVTMAHIHGPANAEQTAGVLVTLFDKEYPGAHRHLVVRGEIKRGVDVSNEIFDNTLKAMREGLAYVNVHTKANPSGEIRGQFHTRHSSGRHHRDS